jgi:hypothetical protein
MSDKGLIQLKDSWLDIPANMTPVSLILPKSLTYEKWADIGQKLTVMNRFTKWALSDWLNYGELKYGETYAQAASATGYAPDYLAIIKYVGGSVDASRRRQNLSFEHHRLVAPLNAEEQECMLAVAESNRWTVAELRTAIQAAKGDDAQEETDDDELITASKLQRWTTQTGDNHWYTAEIYVESARRAMGGIDLDPASSDAAQRIVGAKEYFTEKTDGLKQEWKGRVFLNPPYSYPLIGDFIKKLCDEFIAGNVEAAILLTNNCTDTKWWHEAARASQAICFTQGRINYYKADGRESQPLQGQCFFYFGTDLPAFATEFSKHGLTIGVYPWLRSGPGDSDGMVIR